MLYAIPYHTGPCYNNTRLYPQQNEAQEHHIYIHILYDMMYMPNCSVWNAPVLLELCQEDWFARNDNFACHTGNINSSDAIWWHRFGSASAEVMACCLMASRHYLRQVDIINEVPWHSPESNFTSAKATILYDELWDDTFRIAATSLRHIELIQDYCTGNHSFFSNHSNSLAVQVLVC